MYLSWYWPFSRVCAPIELIEDECPWPCSQPTRAQIRHHRAKSIASNLGNDDYFLEGKYHLICEDSIQKIKSTGPIQEVPFIFYTKFQNLVKKYQDYWDNSSYQIEDSHQTEDREDQESNPEINSDDNGQDYWGNLTNEELQNQDNMMEF